MTERQKTLEQAQVFQQQLQSLSMQKDAMNSQLMEIKNAITELGSSTGEVYKIAGPILVKSAKADVEKDLAEKQEMVSLRIKTLDGQEKLVREKLDKLAEKLK